MKIGIVIRAYAGKSEFIEKAIAGVFKTLGRIAAVAKVPVCPVLVADVVVPQNAAFVDVDCGQLSLALDKKLGEERANLGNLDVSIRSTNADLFCGLLNESALSLAKRGCTHMLVVSSGCADYVTESNIMAIVKAHHEGALISGLAISELAQSIKEGRVANTFGSWHIESLLMVGGFDLRAANARKDLKSQSYLRGANLETGEPTQYAMAGVEEIIPQVRMVDHFGKCIIPIVPVGEAEWVVPTDAAGQLREAVKMGTKFTRQGAMAFSVGADLQYLRSGVIKVIQAGA